MSYLDEQRKQMRTQSESSRLGSLGFLTVLVGAVVLGFLGAQYFLDQPGIAGRVRDALLGTAETAATTQNVYIPNSGKRIGRAEVAPLYRACFHTVKHVHEFGPGVEVDPAIFGILQKAFGTQHEGYVNLFGPMMLCALEHDPTAVCDADNRAMIVDGVNKCLRSAEAVLAGNQGTRHPRPRELTDGEITSMRDRIVFAVEKQARDGRLIKSDFGWFPAPAIIKLFETTRPSRDACAVK